MDFIIYGVVWYANLLLAMTLHEAAHAYAAYLGGDSTAYLGGQVTLDPRPHMQREPFGMVIFPLLTFVLNDGRWMMGWASAPYDPEWARSRPGQSALMAMAGPAANLLLGVLALVFLRVGLEAGAFVRPEGLSLGALVAGTGTMSNSLVPILSIMFSLNFILFAFNLIPLPPLDGSGVLTFFLPVELADKYQDAMRQPILNLIGLVIAWNICWVVIGPVLNFATGLLYSGV